jgi:hypothetical protein
LPISKANKNRGAEYGADRRCKSFTFAHLRSGVAPSVDIAYKNYEKGLLMPASKKS